MSRAFLLAFLTTVSAAVLPSPASSGVVGAPAVMARVAAEPSPDGLQVEEEWTRAIFGYGIGGAGFSIADLDGSGRQKIIATAIAGGQNYWYVASHSSGAYQQEWVSPPFPPGNREDSGITALITRDVDGIPGAEILIGARDELLIYDGATRELLRRVQVAEESIRGLEVADADGDGELEIVFCDVHYFTGVGHLTIYDLATGQEELDAEEYPCWNLAVGNVDGDPSPEIVLGNIEPPGHVLDGATKVIEWTYPAGFGYHVRLGDVDGDGLEEIVAGPTSSEYVTIYDADLRSPTWQIPLDGRLDELQVVDVEGDHLLDIVYGEAIFSSVHAWDPRTRERKWSTASSAHGIDALAVGDTDGDGENELIWSSGSGSTGPDYLYVASTATREIEWQSQDLTGDFLALDFGDVDDDGKPELLYGSASSDSYYGDGIWFIHDARTKALEYESELPGGGWMTLWRIRHANVDGDPQAEILVGTNDAYTGVVICYDGITHAEQWRWRMPDSEGPEGLYSLETADVDGDGEIEAVVGGHHLYVLDGATGLEEWRSSAIGSGSFGSGFTMLRLADVDDDPNLEILAAEHHPGLGGWLFAVDGVTHAEELYVAELPVTALETVDRDGDGTAEILIGTKAGLVAVLDTSTGAFVETLGDYDQPINALAVVDLTEDLVPDLVLAFEEEVAVYDGRSPAERLWHSGLIGSSVGADDSLRVADFDEDGRLEILVNLGAIGLKIYQVGGPGTQLPPGPYLESPELPGFRFKVRITAGGQEFAGVQEADCLAETLCVSGALAGRSELFLRVIGPRPNGFLWANLVRFTPSRVEVWAEQIATGQVNYYELPALPGHDTELGGLVDKQAFSPVDAAGAAAGRSVRPRPLGAAGVSALEPASGLAPRLFGRPGAATFTSEAFPGYRFTVRIFANGEEQPARLEGDCLAETVCVSGALPSRSELFLRIIGPRPNGFLWVNLVRFTTSRVEVEIEQLATGEKRTYVLDQVPGQSDELPGRIDREAFSP